MNILNNKHIILALVFCFTASSFGVDDKAATTMIGQIYTLITYVATAMGLGLMILGGVKMKKRADNPNDVKTFPMSIVVTLIVGSLMFNFSGTANSIIKTVHGDSATYCMIALETQVAGEIPKEACWDASKSEALNDIIDKADAMNEDSAEQIRQNARIFYMVLQTVGFIYFLKGLYHLKLASENTPNTTYFSAFKSIFFSILLLNFQSTYEMVEATISYLGFNI